MRINVKYLVALVNQGTAVVDLHSILQKHCLK
jgi:hypothetical protein